MIEKGGAPRKTPEHNDVRNNYKVTTELYFFPKKRKYR
jgi:hypothetical protein